MTEDTQYLQGGMGEGEDSLLANDSDVDGDALTISDLEGGWSEGGFFAGGSELGAQVQVDSSGQRTYVRDRRQLYGVGERCAGPAPAAPGRPGPLRRRP